MSLIPSAHFSISVIVQAADSASALQQITEVALTQEAAVNSHKVLTSDNKITELEIVIYCHNAEHQTQVVKSIETIEDIKVIEHYDRTFKMHEAGKIRTVSAIEVNDADELSMAYTPGVARVCMAIHEDENMANTHTIRKNTVAIVSDGTAVLGLGDIGPKAAMPVMEGKALLFKEFAGVDAFPICLDVDTPQQVIETVKRLAPSFGGINLEDIAAPGAFEIEEVLKRELDIPVFHDDQHGTAVVALAALENALKVVDKKISEVSVVMTGLGAAGIAVAKMLIQAGVENFVGVDRSGAVYEGRDDLHSAKQWLAENSNKDKKSGTISEVIVDADVFIGLSGPGVITVEDVKSMADSPIVFAMANPTPEILPEEVEGLVAVMATGRSDYPNQINNVLAFPGIFRGALDAGASDITENMKLAAAKAIANSVTEEELSAEFITPSVFDKSVALRVSEAVKQAAIADGA